MLNNFYFMILVGIIVVAPGSAEWIKKLTYQAPIVKTSNAYTPSAIYSSPTYTNKNDYVDYQIQQKINAAFAKLNEAFEYGQKKLDEALNLKVKALEERLYSLRGSLMAEKNLAIKTIESATQHGLDSLNSYSYTTGAEGFEKYVDQQKHTLNDLISSAVPKFKYYIKQCKKYGTYGDDSKQETGQSYSQPEATTYSDKSATQYEKYTPSYKDSYSQNYETQEPVKYAQNTNTASYDYQNTEYKSAPKADVYIKKTPAYKMENSYSPLRAKGRKSN